MAASATIAENIRSYRQRRHLSLSQLAERAGMSKGTLSKLETGAGNPTLETLEALANALAVGLPQLLSSVGPAIEVVRGGEGVDLSDTTATARLIKVLTKQGLHVEVHELIVNPGQSEVSATHGDGSWEHAIVVSGRIEVGPVGGSEVLEPGDYAVYAADRPHLWRALEEGPAHVWIVLTSAQPLQSSEGERNVSP